MAGFIDDMMSSTEETFIRSQMTSSGVGVIAEVAGDLLTAQVMVSGAQTAVRMLVAHHVMPVANMRCGYMQFIVPKKTRRGKPNEGGSEFVVVALFGSRPNMAWIKPTLSNGWTNRGSSWPNMQYRIGPTSHRVEIMGEIVPGVLADGTTIFTISEGYRPPYEQLIIARDAANGVCYLQINADGTVKIIDAAGSTLVQIPMQTFPVDGA